jgi:sulfide:quinone oxidoreductase
MLHDHLVQRGLRDKTTIHLVSPLPMPIPVSQETSDAIVALLAERDIEYLRATRVTRIDPATKTAHLSNDESIAFDLFLGIPVHVCPPVVVDAGMTEDDGWIAVDPATFTTKFPGVYAVGDITSAPVPRAGTIAEGEAAVVANNIIATVRGGEAARYGGQAVCYMEMGDDTVGKVNVDFYKAGGPGATFQAPSLEFAREKEGFGTTRRARWFGYEA